MIASAGAIAIRAAVSDDVPALERLIAESARALGPPFYSDAETEAAITHVFGVDSGLIADGSYFVAERNGMTAGCGGWSRRRTLFGGDRYADRDDAPLDPARDAARIRAFFVASAMARGGVGAALLAHCEAAAVAAGFARAALMATLPGVPFYTRHGYVGGALQSLDCGGVAVRFVPMKKLLPHGNSIAASDLCDQII